MPLGLRHVVVRNRGAGRTSVTALKVPVVGLIASKAVPGRDRCGDSAAHVRDSDERRSCVAAFVGCESCLRLEATLWLRRLPRRHRGRPSGGSSGNAADSAQRRACTLISEYQHAARPTLAETCFRRSHHCRAARRWMNATGSLAIITRGLQRHSRSAGKPHCQSAFAQVGVLAPTRMFEQAH